jgi:hypothetical protein
MLETQLLGFVLWRRPEKEMPSNGDNFGADVELSQRALPSAEGFSSLAFSRAPLETSKGTDA